jgi:bacterioferritin (cytochrome b1)
MLKMMKCLDKQIKSELDKAEEYCDYALKYKDEIEYEHLYKTYVKLAEQEIDHADWLCEDMTLLIAAKKRAQTELPIEISVIYDYIKENNDDRKSKVKIKLEMAKKASY